MPAPPKSSGPSGGVASYPSSWKSVSYISTMRRIVSGRTSAHVQPRAEVAFEVFVVFEVLWCEDAFFEWVELEWSPPLEALER